MAARGGDLLLCHSYEMEGVALGSEGSLSQWSVFLEAARECW